MMKWKKEEIEKGEFIKKDEEGKFEFILKSDQKIDVKNEKGFLYKGEEEKELIQKVTK